jgi:hypothetical protein
VTARVNHQYPLESCPKQDWHDLSGCTVEVPPLTPEAQRAVISAARALLERLDLVHADDRYKAVWEIAQLHIGPYTGLQYESELLALRKALVTDEPSSP